MSLPSPTVASMLVVACTDHGGVRLERRDRPQAGPGEIRIRLRWCGLCGTDLFKLNNATAGEGTVLGHEVVGIVDAIGPGVAGLATGDRIVAPHHVACGDCALCRRGADTQCPSFKENLLFPGGFAEHVVVRERATRLATWLVPEGVPDAAAAFMEPAACVLRGVDKATLPSVDGCAVIVGAGSMGLLHLLLLGAIHPDMAVVVCDPLEERRAVASDLGAAAVCPPAHDELVAAVRSLSSGVGADAVFDTVGGSGPLSSGLETLRPGGALVLFAHARDGEPAGFELNPFFKAEHRLVGTYSGGLAEQRRVAELLAAGVFDPSPLVTHRLPLACFAEAVTLATTRQALKILIGPGP